MKRVATLASGLFLLVSTAGCCHHLGGCMPGGPAACPPGGYGTVPVYPQTGAIYNPSTATTAQVNYSGVPVAAQPVIMQTAFVPLESLPTY
ncbi:MAG TPA: hypothetical protein VML55_03490 [Planctomycetaceae bacterium]|nr:hypothetical protein [Planctomycetaceae bacterium]